MIKCKYNSGWFFMPKEEKEFFDPSSIGQKRSSVYSKGAFEQVSLGEGVIPQNVLLEKRVPEMRAELVPIIEEIWREEILSNE